jgi:shikimate dehydrogenase
MTGRPPGGGRRGAAVLGSPIAHSLSPVLHLAAYDALGLADWTYRAVECTAAELDTTLDVLDAEGLAGVSLTMPLKRQVLPRLARRDHWSEVVGAANTVLFGDANEWSGANTDVPGMVAALGSLIDRQPSLSGATILGAGATAASAIAVVAELGGRQVTLVARRPEAALDLEPLAVSLGLEVTTLPWPQIRTAVEHPLVIATTPAGATDDLAHDLPAVSGVLFDVVYAPWPTPLAQAWQAAGGAVVGGLELLVEQAALQVELMTGQPPPVDVMRRAGYAAVAG